MDVMFFCVGTIITSFLMEVSYNAMRFKDAADNGYKIDSKRLSELNSQTDTGSNESIIISLFIPVANIVDVFLRAIKYNLTRATIIDRLRITDCLIPMTKEEEEKYKKNPTAMNAFWINVIKYDSDQELMIQKFNRNSIPAKESFVRPVRTANKSYARLKILKEEKHKWEELKRYILVRDIENDTKSNEPLIKQNRRFN